MVDRYVSGFPFWWRQKQVLLDFSSICSKPARRGREEKTKQNINHTDEAHQPLIMSEIGPFQPAHMEHQSGKYVQCVYTCVFTHTFLLSYIQKCNSWSIGSMKHLLLQNIFTQSYERLLPFWVCTNANVSHSTLSYQKQENSDSGVLGGSSYAQGQANPSPHPHALLMWNCIQQWQITCPWQVLILWTYLEVVHLWLFCLFDSRCCQ